MSVIGELRALREEVQQMFGADGDDLYNNLQEFCSPTAAVVAGLRLLVKKTAEVGDINARLTALEKRAIFVTESD